MVDVTAVPAASGFAFGPFRLLTAQRALLRDGRPVRLGGRAFDILTLLVERAGQLVSRQDLALRAWPDTHVIDGTLTVHVAALRRALDDGLAGTRYIVNTPGQGYALVAPVTVIEGPASPARSVAAGSGPGLGANNLPSQTPRLVGRDTLVGDLRRRLDKRRLLTLIGPGGIGKTALALAMAMAEDLTDAYADGVWLVELGAIIDPRLAPTVLAQALRLAMPADDPLPGLVNALRDKQMLLVLDNCEHVIEQVAFIATSLLENAPGVRILATSREPLRIEGEQAYRVPSLESPADSPRLAAAQALAFPAVQLFAERAASAMAGFVLTDADAPSAARIGRVLDGLPLAIELAAAGVERFGVQDLAARLDARLEPAVADRRAAPARHRTLGATLDWSYQLLSAPEQSLFRRLSVFMGGFTLESATAVAAETPEDTATVADLMTGLMLKSLVTPHFANGELRLRLLETTRAFALRKLAEHGEIQAASRRQAVYCRDLVDSAAKAADGAFLAVVAAEIDNIRAALAWAFGPGGDEEVATALAAGSAPILLHMYLLPECHHWMAKAVDALSDADRGTRREMVLQCALGLALMYTQSTSDRAQQALTRACALAEAFDERGWQLQALLALAAIRHRFEDFDEALALAKRAVSVATLTGDGLALGRAQAVLSSALMLLARYDEAVAAGREAHQKIDAVRQAHIIREGTIHAIYAQVTVAAGLWAQGRLASSARTTRALTAEAEAGGDPVSLCLALTWCRCPLALRLDDLDAAERLIAQLQALAEKSGLRAYLACAVALEGQLAVQRGDLARGEARLRAGLAALDEARNAMFATPHRIDLAQLLIDQGRADEALAVVAEAAARAETHGGWCATELLRVQGEIALSKGDAGLAEAALNRAVARARHEGALTWELRAAISLGQLRAARGETRQAHDLLGEVHARFTEGFDAPDLRRAQALLASWGTA
ncbi:hypothetical protein ASD79_21110 [Caulobacter sp. Root655]|nr:hypothetical protein ASD79_21110 [Caulobacter sp. Root655]